RAGERALRADLEDPERAVVVGPEPEARVAVDRERVRRRTLAAGRDLGERRLRHVELEALDLVLAPVRHVDEPPRRIADDPLRVSERAERDGRRARGNAHE